MAKSYTERMVDQWAKQQGVSAPVEPVFKTDAEYQAYQERMREKLTPTPGLRSRGPSPKQLQKRIDELQEEVEELRRLAEGK